MTENRNGFVVEAELRQASGTVEREAATAMIVRHSPGAQRITVGADKGFDTAGFVADLRDVQRHAARRPEHERSPLRHRWPHHPASGLRDQPAEAQAGRGAVRLGQDDRRAGAAHAARRQEARLQVHLDDGRLRSHQAAEIDRSGGMNGRRDTTKPNAGVSGSQSDRTPRIKTGKRRSSTTSSAAC